jgi:uncharacterized membrane protein YecN with MAPEG domain
MVPIIVPAYAAAFAFVYILLSVRVIRARWRARVSIGTKGDISLERTIRVHANFAEYVPFALLLATFVEMQNGPAWLVHLLCLALLLGRIVHAYGVSQERENVRLRIAGMATTFAVFAITALALLARAISALINSN